MWGSEKPPGAADTTAAGTVDGQSCAFGSNAFVCPNGTQAMNAEFAAFMAEYDGGNGAGPAPDPESEEATPELVPPDNTVLALAAAPVVNQCTVTTKRKKRCKNKVKKGSTNGLCSVHQSKDADPPDNDAAGPPAAEPTAAAAAAAPAVFKFISAVLPEHGIEFEGNKAGQAEAKHFASELQEMRDSSKLKNVQYDRGRRIDGSRTWVQRTLHCRLWRGAVSQHYPTAV